MANEVYASAQGDTLATHVFAAELEMLLHQRPYMRRLAKFAGDTRGSNSTTIKIGQIDHDDIAEATNEGSAISANTAITDASYTLTPGRQAIKRVLSNLLAGIDGTGLMNEATLAEYNFAAVMKRFDALFGAAHASLTGTAGTSGAPMTVDDWFTATQTLRTRRVTGKLAANLHPHQFNNLQTDLRGEVGPFQLTEEVQAAVATSSGQNLVAYLQGIPIFTSDQVPDANTAADHDGALFKIPEDASVDSDTGKYMGDAAIAYAEGSPNPVTMAGGRIMAADGVVYTDLDIDVDKGDVHIVTAYFVAVGVADAAKGIKIRTDHV